MTAPSGRRIAGVSQYHFSTGNLFSHKNSAGGQKLSGIQSVRSLAALPINERPYECLFDVSFAGQGKEEKEGSLMDCVKGVGAEVH